MPLTVADACHPDLPYLTDMAWHDCYGPRELEMPPQVLDDVLLLARGNFAMLIRVARDAVLAFGRAGHRPARRMCQLRRLHCWLVPPLQSQITAAVPMFVP